MFHYRLIELEAELAAKEQSQKGLDRLTVECATLLDYLQQQVGVRLADPVPRDWKGWLSYKRAHQSLVICRGRAFKQGMFGKHKAGMDVGHGADAISEAERGFDVTPPQDLDHLLVNFGGAEAAPRVFLWYGENIAPYKLIFAADVNADPHIELSEAVVEACTWIIKRPKDMTLSQFLETLSK
jgi:hypothetical protein